uniref:CCHC-type domain-containing protein n=1 Tax=Tanacetum cinerariifolium TaxID=118510 RepID=A0A699GVG7_TANCI|nr:hypothetical protein [Tanacetum cinerariifolium]
MTPLVTHIDTILIHAEVPTVSPIISPYPYYTPASLDYSPTSDTEFDPSEDPSSDRIPPLPATLPFLSSIVDSSDSNTPDTPPSPTHDTPFTEITLSTQRSPAASGVLRRQRVEPLPTHRLDVRHSVDYSSSDHFTSDNSLRDSPSSSSSDSSSDSLSDTSSSHSSSDHSSPALPSGTRPSHQLCSLVSRIPHSSATIIEIPSHSSFAGPSRKRSRSPTTTVLIYSHLPGALSSVRVDLLPPPKRIGSFDSVTDLEDCSDESSKSSVPRETSLRDDVVGIDTRVMVETVAREEAEMSTMGPVKVIVERVMHPAVPDDVPDPAQEEGAIKGTYEMLGDLGHMSVATGRHSAVLTERISELERDNTRLRDTKMPNTRSGATMIREAVNELIDHRGDENGDDYEGGNGGVNGNGGNGGNKNGRANGNGNGRGNGNGNDNGNGNGNEGGNGYNFIGFMYVSRKCTYQDFLKCQPLNFNGTKGVVGLTRWFEKMETRAIGFEATYAMKWTELMKLMTEVYCPRNKIQKIETRLWKLTGNVIAAEPTRLTYAIHIANNLMDKKLKGYARSAKNKRRGQNVARAYMVENNARKGYVGSLPYYNKCMLHHEGSCTVRCANCKRVGHITRECTVIVAPNTQRAPIGNQPGIVCYECGRP